jgi:outer membrane protein assembly factor BamB
LKYNIYFLKEMATKTKDLSKAVILGCMILISTANVLAQDWPQWRGPNRDGKAGRFVVPEKCPTELAQKWKVLVGKGTDSTPALVGDRLFVFTRQGADEVILCLDADTGQEMWKDSYVAEARTTTDRGHPGPRSSPAVANGMVITLGISGTLSCLDAATGNLKWCKNDFPGDLPRFNTAMSLVIVDGLCIGQFGGQNNVAVVAYDLATGGQKWKWNSPGTSHASPNVMAIEGTKMAVVITANNVVGINIANGVLLWEMPFEPGRGRQCVTPIIDGQNVICCGGLGQGIKAVAIKKNGDNFVINELWNYTDNYVEFNTPILKDGLLFAFSQRGNYFCVNAKTGQAVWTQSSGMTSLNIMQNRAVTVPPVIFGSERGSGGRGGMRGGHGGGMGIAGFGSIVDASSVLIGLNSSSRLVIFEPSNNSS